MEGRKVYEGCCERLLTFLDKPIQIIYKFCKIWLQASVKQGTVTKLKRYTQKPKLLASSRLKPKDPVYLSIMINRAINFRNWGHHKRAEKLFLFYFQQINLLEVEISDSVDFGTLRCLVSFAQLLDDQERF